MRAALYVLLAVVAAAAAVLSFNALRDLAELCGISPAWLLPVVVDAGAAAGSLVWLGGHGGTRAALFARRLALALLGVSIVANALSHGAESWEAGRPLWVIVVVCVVSALPPAVLGAVIHLAVRCRQGSGSPDSPAAVPPAGDVAPGGVASPPRRPDWESLGEPAAEHASKHASSADSHPAADQQGPGSAPGDVPPDVPVAPAPGEQVAEPDRAGELIAAGYGRRRLAAALEIPEHEARELLAARRNGSG